MKWKSVFCEMKGLNIYYFVYLRNTIDNLVHWAIDHLPIDQLTNQTGFPG